MTSQCRAWAKAGKLAPHACSPDQPGLIVGRGFHGIGVTWDCGGLAQQPLLLEPGPRLRGFAQPLYDRRIRGGETMGIQDRDYYWRDRDARESAATSAPQPHGSGRPPVRVSSDWANLHKPKRNSVWAFLNRPWVAPFVWGLLIGKNWDGLKTLGQLFYDRFIGVLF